MLTSVFFYILTSNKNAKILDCGKTFVFFKNVKAFDLKIGEGEREGELGAKDFLNKIDKNILSRGNIDIWIHTSLVKYKKN